MNTKEEKAKLDKLSQIIDRIEYHEISIKSLTESLEGHAGQFTKIANDMRKKILQHEKAVKQLVKNYNTGLKNILHIFNINESFPSDDEIKLTDNGFGALEDAVKKAKG